MNELVCHLFCSIVEYSVNEKCILYLFFRKPTFLWNKKKKDFSFLPLYFFLSDKYFTYCAPSTIKGQSLIAWYCYDKMRNNSLVLESAFSAPSQIDPTFSWNTLKKGSGYWPLLFDRRLTLIISIQVLKCRHFFWHSLLMNYSVCYLGLSLHNSVEKASQNVSHSNQ